MKLWIITRSRRDERDERVAEIEAPNKRTALETFQTRAGTGGLVSAGSVPTLIIDPSIGFYYRAGARRAVSK